LKHQVCKIETEDCPGDFDLQYQSLVQLEDNHPMANRNTSISLGDHMLSFAQQVASGRYSSTSDVVRAGLRMLEDHESRAQALREALITGENSGLSTPFDFDSFIAARRTGRPPGDGQ
jgi:antitoxin ParD1/3/4